MQPAEGAQSKEASNILHLDAHVEGIINDTQDSINISTSSHDQVSDLAQSQLEFVPE